MTENALLIVAHPQLAHQQAGGMSVLERQLWTMRRAGIRRVWVSLEKPLNIRLPDGLEIVWHGSQAVAEASCPKPYLAVSGDHFVRVDTLRYVAEAHYPVPVTLADSTGTAVIQALPVEGARAQPARQQLPDGCSVKLETPVAQGRAVSWLLALGHKSADGFMARNFDRRISLAVSKLLLDTPVTPNMMTLASSAIGLLGAALFLWPAHGTRLAGALLVWLHSVLDGCDGELARIRFQESAFGADLDFWLDNLVHLALFGCMAWGFAMADQSMLPIFLGGCAAVGTLGSAWLNYLQRLDKRRNPASAAAVEAAGMVPTLQKVGDMLAARDFIYLLVLLAWLDRLYEFMWATGVGSLMFFGLMMYLGRKHREQASQPHPPRQGQVGSPAAGDGSGHQHLHRGR